MISKELKARVPVKKRSFKLPSAKKPRASWTRNMRMSMKFKANKFSVGLLTAVLIAVLAMHPMAVFADEEMTNEETASYEGVTDNQKESLAKNQGDTYTAVYYMEPQTTDHVLLPIVTLIIELIGACAWIPTLLEYTENKKENVIYGSFKDIALIRKFRRKTKRNGIVEGVFIIMAVNFHTLNHFYITRCEVKIKFTDSDKFYKTKICNQVKFKKRRKNNKLIPMIFDFPKESSVLKRPFLLSLEDNIKIIPCLLECKNCRYSLKQRDLDKVIITLFGSGHVKQKIVIDVENTDGMQKGYIAGFAKENFR